MILSMTSYGRASSNLENKRIIVELKTLNSKFIDLRLKVPSNFHEKEMWVRKYIHDQVLRGKIEATFTYENEAGGENYSINQAAFKKYYNQLGLLAQNFSFDPATLASSILRLPEIVSTSEESISDEEWTIIRSTLEEAISNLKKHREEEGSAIENDLVNRIEKILSYLEKVEPYEMDRVEKVRTKMNNNLNEYFQRQNVDEHRFEQEILFYLEKMDITEEKVRLKQHCDYFLQELAIEKWSKGKKLNFISQEIGREINTLGAKAYSSEIQKLVVLMKDELEKIKEHVANVL